MKNISAWDYQAQKNLNYLFIPLGSFQAKRVEVREQTLVNIFFFFEETKKTIFNTKLNGL
jgi:hypothetical protein